ncbi:hypothetical protein FKM82_009714 [Ascaphus truei]
MFYYGFYYGLDLHFLFFKYSGVQCGGAMVPVSFDTSEKLTSAQNRTFKSSYSAIDIKPSRFGRRGGSARPSPAEPFGPERFSRRTHFPSWSSLFALQCPEGYWLMTPAFGPLIQIDVNYLMNVFLFQKGICSLGAKGKEEVLKLIATLLVLQLLRCSAQLLKFNALMILDESSRTSPFYPRIEKAIKWARKADQQYSGICSRLDLGKDWDSATRQLLRIEPMKASSKLYLATTF